MRGVHGRGPAAGSRSSSKTFGVRSIRVMHPTSVTHLPHLRLLSPTLSQSHSRMKYDDAEFYFIVAWVDRAHPTACEAGLS